MYPYTREMVLEGRRPEMYVFLCREEPYAGMCGRVGGRRLTVRGVREGGWKRRQTELYLGHRLSQSAPALRRQGGGIVSGESLVHGARKDPLFPLLRGKGGSCSFERTTLCFVVLCLVLVPFLFARGWLCVLLP